VSTLILVGGGARSGKSAFALARASELGARRAFVATAQAFDAEMRARIAAHVAERGDAFRTYEAPHALPEALAEIDADVIVVDCLTLWLSNLLLQDRTSDQVAAEVERLAAVLERRRTNVVLVTNEVGMGIVPDNALARTFRDVAGRAHQRLAALADEIHFAALGVLLRLHPEPVTVTRPRFP
jgi:adenosylcobinamide kinase/adenosylcobinamide-phosphate guanylyltransferase